MGRVFAGVQIKAMVSLIESNRAAQVSEKARITADYQSANVASSITFDVLLEQAREFYVGQTLVMEIRPA